MLSKAHAVLLVEDDEQDNTLLGYVLLLFSQGTSMARLYSIAVAPQWRGRGIARQLLEAAEALALENDCVSLRLEIRRDNLASQALFRAAGYKPFKVVPDYYEDHMDAVRVEKHLAPHLNPEMVRVPFYRQTLEFTCGSASLMMAMKTLNPGLMLDRKLELRLWREATTIFMTSGHGGCGPYGLALAAHRRGFEVQIFVNEEGVFLIDSVRSSEKKEVIRLVQEDMLSEIAESSIALHHGSLGVAELQQYSDSGYIPLVLISYYRMYGERVPHWVVITGFDSRYVYTHDPYVDTKKGETMTDSINMPIPHRDFEHMARYGKARQKAVLLIRAHASRESAYA
jgi:GNAT superfamily N-acetyltransferase